MASQPFLMAGLLADTSEPVAAPTLEELYDRYAEYVYQSLRRLGVPSAGVPDALQDVFVVVHRRLADLDSSGSVKSWLFALALGVARNHRRTLRRKAPERDGIAVDPDHLGGRFDEPFERTAHAESVELFYRLLENLDEDKRAVFVLAELEELTVPEIATALSINVNTAYARLRAARQKFEQSLARFRAREHGGNRP